MMKRFWMVLIALFLVGSLVGCGLVQKKEPAATGGGTTAPVTTQPSVTTVGQERLPTPPEIAGSAVEFEVLAHSDESFGMPASRYADLITCAEELEAYRVLRSTKGESPICTEAFWQSLQEVDFSQHVVLFIGVTYSPADVGTQGEGGAKGDFRLEQLVAQGNRLTAVYSSDWDGGLVLALDVGEESVLLLDRSVFAPIENEFVVSCCAYSCTTPDEGASTLGRGEVPIYTYRVE